MVTVSVAEGGAPLDQSAPSVQSPLTAFTQAFVVMVARW
jgi:hypothetical protein